jgi:hypothetical protein
MKEEGHMEHQGVDMSILNSLQIWELAYTMDFI